jgi:hypothetical protein
MSIIWKWNILDRAVHGTEEFWVPAVIAAVGAAGQGVNQMNANKRGQNAQVQAMDNQDQFREQANSQVKNLTQQIATNSPQAIANKETGDFVQNLRKNEAGSAAPGATSNTPDTNFGQPVSALAPATGASSRYKTSTANAQTQTQEYGNDNAEQMSAIDSAVRQRQNEGLALNTLGTNLNVLGARSASQGWVDQLRARAAGTTSPWADMFSSMLQKGAGAYAANGAGTPAPYPGNGGYINANGPMPFAQ